MQTIMDKIGQARGMARVLGWRECRRASITKDGDRVTLRIRYLPGPAHHVRQGDPEDGTVIDMANMPTGVDVVAWIAPPDDVFDLGHGVTESDVRAIADTLGRPVVTRGNRSDGITIYWMDP